MQRSMWSFITVLTGALGSSIVVLQSKTLPVIPEYLWTWVQMQVIPLLFHILANALRKAVENSSGLQILATPVREPEGS